MLHRGTFLVFLLAWQVSSALAAEGQWRAGVAGLNITPELPIWLSGYAARNMPAAEKLDYLWAKALALEDADGHRAVLVTIDLVGIDRELSRDVCRRIEERFKLPRAATALAVSHTHSGPVVGNNLAPMYALDEQQTAQVAHYTAELTDNLVNVVGMALEKLEPAQLSCGSGTATFAVNRRNNPEAEVPQRRLENALVGPVDHDVPVLAIHDVEGHLRAIVCGYACHATVLDGYVVSGDWPGAAQSELEQRHANAVALFWAGCGADQNPIPRRSVELVHQYGKQLADAVDATLQAPLKPVASSLRTAYEEIDLPFGPLPSREQLQLDAAGQPPQAPWAKHLLKTIERDGSLPATYPYPVQAWRLGTELTWVFLGGEVVVDYSLRLKSELGPENTWVAGYSNDVMGYIPSRRVLAEGGYEGGGAGIYYGLPAAWAPKVEQQIVDTAHRLSDKE